MPVACQVPSRLMKEKLGLSLAWKWLNPCILCQLRRQLHSEISSLFKNVEVQYRSKTKEDSITSKV